MSVDQVSIHAPARGATRLALKQDHNLLGFQSTHPRGVRRWQLCWPCAGERVSIHAPARGATSAYPDFLPGSPLVSIHAPARGATPRGRHRKSYQGRFNPRTREGCDWGVDMATRVSSRVSIHAPARGATTWMSSKDVCCSSFNPRTREGCDNQLPLGNLALPSFNPRTREGCDTPAVCRKLIADWFQSTHPRGVRPAVYGILGPYLRVSIHAPARGATPTVKVAFTSRTCFNPRTREGCDGRAATRGSGRGGFNPRTREGCDSTAASLWPQPNGFQSTHPRGVRPAATHEAAASLTLFQSTHPRGVRPIRQHVRHIYDHVSIHAPARGATFR